MGLIAMALAAAWCSGGAASAGAIRGEPEARPAALRPQPVADVMLVGVYHMHNPGADQHNFEADDVLAERRQAEIAAVTARLAAWSPDLVLVEWTRDDAARLDALYDRYREGGGRDNRNEIAQLGFRLADALGHDRVAAIDVDMPFVADEQIAAEAQGDARLLSLKAEIQAYGQDVVARQAERLSALSVGDYLAHLNSPESLTENHDYYVRHLIRLWSGENQGGAHTIHNWYGRNIFIFQNLLREVEESGGQARRVVVFFGYGHVPTLAQLIEDTPWLTLVDPSPYLADR
ncbi:hypothetical protein E4M02_06050 [Brevundimonas sp. S30B]|uniref:DUF5694 domain-containing protein n=1 Tax=unclassified Brevundimonas TaxID=2622653 RepID=UPI00107230FC|nr:MULTISPECIES: DUF5694 domain-containing protein [unclassified Brevundimonas]QBX38083.1 hypothetical protein E4M01_10090 [Brevundimonas sp. MF30-B]TFW02563.1 hypothetical protein E4M02_06050 [Brevundimonas sp. S30B]